MGNVFTAQNDNFCLKKCVQQKNEWMKIDYFFPTKKKLEVPILDTKNSLLILLFNFTIILLQL